MYPDSVRRPSRYHRCSLLLLGLVASSHAAVPKDEVVSLTPFEVRAGQSGSDRYRTEQSNAGTILAKDRAKIPVITTVLTEELLADLRLDNPSDYAQFVAGMSNTVNGQTLSADTPAGGGSLNYMIRGFNSDPLFNGFKIDGLIRNPDNVGRVEVIKTPNSVLYGQGAAGGIIDIATKAPRFGENSGSFMVGAGTSDSSSRANSTRARIDSTGSWGKHAAVRFNAGYQQFDREQYFFKSELVGFGGGLKLKLGERTTLDVASEISLLDSVPSRTAAFVSLGAGPARVVDPYNRLRRDRNFTYSGPYSNTDRTTTITSVSVTSQLTDAVTVRVGAIYGRQTADSLGYSTNLSTQETDPLAVWQKFDDGRHVSGQKIDLVHQAKIWGLSVDTLVGFENHLNRATNLILFTVPAVTPASITIPFSRRTQASDWPLPPSPSTFTSLNTHQRSRTEWTNLRLTQFVESSDGNTTAMWGVAKGEGESAVDNLRNGTRAKSKGDDITYSAGATRRVFAADRGSLVNSAILFANYSTSFTIQGGNQQNPNQFNGFTSLAALQAYVNSLAPNPVEPQTGEGWEAGVRVEMLDRRLRLSLAYFDQERANIARNFFVRPTLVPGQTSEAALASYQLAAGAERARGVDGEINWQLTKAVSLLASAMVMNGKVVSNPESPEEVGFGLVSTPETQLSLWAFYRPATDSPLAGFSGGLGASYNTSTRIRPEVGDRFRVSDRYTLGRVMLRYKLKNTRLAHEFALNVDNVLDREYVDEGNWLSEPRTYKFSYMVSW